jgi:hypothetical protein
MGEKNGDFDQKYYFIKKIYRNLGLQKNFEVFLRKLVKIAENCDHNIDP